MCRISTDRFAALSYDFNSSPQMLLLDVFELDLNVPLPAPKHLATYQFPKMSLSQPPTPTIVSSLPGYISPSFIDENAWPCYTSSVSGLLRIEIEVPRHISISTCSIFVSPRPFLTIAPNKDGKPSSHPWSSWGPPATRWIKNPTGFYREIRPYGYRFGQLGRILDFNPYDIGRELCSNTGAVNDKLASPGPSDEDISLTQIITHPSIIFSDEHIKENIVSSLAYRETLYDVPDCVKSPAVCFVEENLYYVEVRLFFRV